MTQNINFYQPALRKQATKFSARAMVQAGAAVTVAVLVIYGYSLVQVSELRAQLREADQQRDAATQRLAGATQQFIAGNPSGGEQARIEQLEKEILAYQQVQRVTQAEGLSNSAGYSGYLIAFARRNVPGMWLTRFEIGGRGETLLLEGRSTVPELVPRYLHSLAQEPALTGMAFKLFQIQRPEVADKRSTDGYVEFRVGTTESDAGSGAQGAGS